MSSSSGCPGPNSTAWDSGFMQCVGSNAQTSCDSVGQQTCYYGFLSEAGGPDVQGLPFDAPELEGKWLGGQFLPDGKFLIGLVPSLLSKCGFKPGTIVSMLNGRPPRQKIIQSFTPKSPGRYVKFSRDSAGCVELIIRKTTR